MLLTVGIVNLLSHVAPLFTGQDVSLHLNKLQPIEVMRHWIGESNTSAFQQQQFQHQLKMLLSGGGEGGGIASPIASRGNGGVSREDQLPRQSISDSADEQSSVPHLSNTPSKRIRPSSDDIIESSVDTSQGFKKARLSHNSAQRPSEEQEQISPQSGGLNISQDSIDRSSIFQGGDNEARASSEQASRAVQNAPSFDDLLTQAIQAVSPQTSSPVKKNISEAQLTSQQTSIPAPAVSQISTVIPVKPVEQSTPVLTPSSQVAPSVTTKSKEVETVSVSSSSSAVSSAPSASIMPVEIIVTNNAETVSDLATPLTSQQAPAAAVSQTLTVTQPVEKSISTPPAAQEKTQALVQAPTPSAQASLSNESATHLFRSKEAPPLIESTTLQVAPVVIPEPMEEETSNDESMTEALSSAAKEAMKRLTNLFNSMSSEDMETVSSADSAFKQSTSQQTPSETTESMETETIVQSDPSASVDPDRQKHQRKMGSVAEELRKQFNQKQANSEQNTQHSEEAKSEETKSNPSASVDPALQQQRKSMFNELKGFQFNKGQQKKSQSKQKPEDGKSDPVLQKKTNNVVDELKRRLSQRQVQGEQKSEDMKSDSSTSQNEFNRFGLRKTSRFDELVHGKLPESKPLESNQVATTPQKPVAMKKGELGKKSSLATIATPEVQLNELILKQEKLEKSIEWQRKNIPQFKPAESLRELGEIKGKIGALRRQVDRENKAIKPITQDLASPSVSTDVTSNPIGLGRPSLSSLFSTTQVNLLEGIKGGVELSPVKKKEKKKARQRKEPTNDLEKKLFSMRQVMEDDDSDDDNGIDLSYLSKSVDIPPVSTPVKTLPKPISADISPTKRAKFAMLGKASPQATSTLSLSEQLRAAKKTKKKNNKKNSPPVIEPVEKEREVNAFTSSLFSSSAWNSFSRLSPSTASSDSDDDDWD
ncbi:hypothetical protein QPK87_29570 [Kamptonema cortianum]|nr:hypothetical protein [Kamptonema cortianum]